MASASALAEDLLAGEELAHRSEEPARGARTTPLPDEARPAGARARSASTSSTPPARGLGCGRARRAPRGHHGHRVRKTLAFNLPVLDELARTPKSRVLYLYPTKALAQDQFRTLSGLRAAAEAGDLRRRHAGRAALADPEVGERDPDEPGHGPRRPAAEPRALGRRPREPALRRHRRGPRLPRRVRVARRQCAAAAAADGADLRLGAAVPARPATISNPGELHATCSAPTSHVERRQV